jgi:uncharacterized protein involved in exopolysaccharide biosynthesis
MQINPTSRDILSALFRRKGTAISVFLFCIIAGLAYLLLATPLYEADGSLLVRFGHDAAPDVSVADQTKNQTELSQNDRKEVIESDIEILKSHDMLMTLVKEFGAINLYPALKNPDFSGETPEERAIYKLLHDDLTVKDATQSDVIEVDFLNHDTKLAVGFVNRMFQLFTQRQSDVYNNPQSGFLAEQVNIAAERLSRSEAALHEFKTSNGLSSMEDEMGQLLKEKSDASTVAFQAVDDAKTQLNELQAKETELLATYRSDSPVVARVRKNIALAQSQIHEREQELQDTNSTGDAAHHNLLKLHLQAIDTRIADLENKRSHYNELVRQASIDEENYKSYRTRSEEARVNEKLNEKNITRISVVDHPVETIKPARPRRLLTVALALFAAIVFGLGSAICLELWDERFTRPEQLAAFLGIPLMASFTTVAEA